MKKGIRTLLDLLFFIPIRYEERTRITSIHQAIEDENGVILGRVTSGGEERFPRSRKRLFRILVVDDGGGAMELIWFRYRKPHLSAVSTPGTMLAAYGKVRKGNYRKQMIHPEIRVVSERGPIDPGLVGAFPVYSAVRGIAPSALRKIIEAALGLYLPSLIDPVPDEIRKENGLPDLAAAIKNVHVPPAAACMQEFNEFNTPFHRRITFDRFFLVMLVVAFLKRRRLKRPAPMLSIPPGWWKDLSASLSFDLTEGQSKALKDILDDFASGRAMNRLLMGDVGCGKTIVAALAAALCVRNGYQAALMTPTRLLAEQHLGYFSDLPPGMGFRTVLVSGRLKREARLTLYREIKEGKHNLIIGTQSLVQEGLSFRNLGLVIIDEQQRFGVRERALLDRKGVHSHQLVMTATPIPRTLAIAAYGDLDVSEIRQFPVGRAPVCTHLITNEPKRTVFEKLSERLAKGQQAFVICPAIEGGEEEMKDAVRMAQRLMALLSPRYQIGLIHGRLSPEDRESVMERFRKGRVHLLVGTTVLEVGVHVPGATVMIVEHPERFGLSQLHQLRGRVGRGSEPGLCFLMAGDNIHEKALQRLQVLVEHEDGFEIARKDLEQRGYGQFAGTRQVGIGELDISEMLRESELLSKAIEAANKLIGLDPDLSKPEHRLLRTFVDSMLVSPVDI